MSNTSLEANRSSIDGLALEMYENMSLSIHEFESKSIWGVVVFSLLTIFGTIANLSVVIVLVKSRNMLQTSTNVLMLYLAISDLIFSAICGTTQVIEDSESGYWPFSEWSCKFRRYLYHTTANISNYTLVLLAFDRFFAIVLPQKTLYRSLKSTYIQMVVLTVSIGTICINAYVWHGFIKDNYLSDDYMDEEESSMVTSQNETSEDLTEYQQECTFILNDHVMSR